MRYCIFVILSFCMISCDLLEDPDSKPRRVYYEVNGTASVVDITISNASGDTEQYSDIVIPWEKTFTVSKGAFLYVSAQNQGQSGTVTVVINVNDDRFKDAASTGAYVIATASGSAP